MNDDFRYGRPDAALCTRPLYFHGAGSAGAADRDPTIDRIWLQAAGRQDQGRREEAGPASLRNRPVHRQRLGVLAATASVAFALITRQAEAVAINAQDAAAQSAHCQSPIVRASP